MNPNCSKCGFFTLYGAAGFCGKCGNTDAEGTTVTERCPSCGGVLMDMRATGFSAKAMANEGTCVLWAEGQYQCSVEERKRRQFWRERGQGEPYPEETP